MNIKTNITRKVPIVDFDLVNYQSSKDQLGKFRFWHVESLLNQAADLLERCHNERLKYNELNSKWSLLVEEITEVEKQLQITDERVKAGWLTLNQRMLEYEINEKSKLTGNYNEVYNLLKFLQDQQRDYHGTDQHAIYGTGAHIEENNIARGNANAEIGSKKIQLDWEIQNILFQQTAIQNSKDALQRKKDLMFKPNAALNYAEQCDVLCERIKQDFMDAYDRITVAADGLKTIYGYEVVKPVNIFETDKLWPIDASIKWTRNAIRWLTAFSQLDQAFSITLSLKTQVGEGKWTNALANASNMLTFSFEVKKNLFDSHKYVRLRGISAFVIDKEKVLVIDQKIGNSIWHGWLQLPKEALSFRQDTVPQPINQKNLPRCYLGRIESRNSPRSPEITGLISLMNASPIGAEGEKGLWSFSISLPPGKRSDFSDLKDIELELNLTGQPI